MKVLMLIIFSFLAAMVLTILPLPNWLNWARPEWVVLVVIYWVLMNPTSVSIGVAWLIGLSLDVLTGSVLGAHALALICVAYVITRFNMRLHRFNLWKTTIIVFIAVCCYRLVMFCIYGALGSMPDSALFWLPCLTSAVFWPWIYILISGGEKHFELLAVL